MDSAAPSEDAVLAFVREGFRRAAAATWEGPEGGSQLAAINAVQQALVGYEAALRARSVDAFARSLGMDPPPVADPADAARELYRAADHLLHLAGGCVPLGLADAAAGDAPEADGDPPDDKGAAEAAAWPALRAWLHGPGVGPLVIFGGKTHEARRRWAARAVGVDLGRVVWEEIEDGSNSRAGTRLGERILNGHVGAVVMLSGKCSHAQTIPVMDACRRTGVRVAPGGRGGTGEMRTALDLLERDFERGVCGAPEVAAHGR